MENTRKLFGIVVNLHILKQLLSESRLSRWAAMKTVFRTHCKSSFSGLRRGVAAMETAVCLPFIAVMIFSGVELSNAVFLKQSINLAAYEAAKLITAPGNNADKAGTRVKQILLSRKVTNYTFTSTPAVTASTPTGTMITVVVSAPATNLSYGPVLIMAGKTVSSTVVMSRL